MKTAALVLFVVYPGVGFGSRSWVQIRADRGRGLLICRSRYMSRFRSELGTRSVPVTGPIADV